MSELTKEQQFFQKLNRLFQSSAIIKKKGKKQIIVKDLDLKQSFKTNIRQNTVHSGMYVNQSTNSALNVFRPSSMMDRMARYTDYELMDLDGLASSVLDIYSEESLTDNEDGDIDALEERNHVQLKPAGHGDLETHLNQLLDRRPI